MIEQLLDTLERLANAALRRETTTGDPCNLIAAREELESARVEAWILIEKVRAKKVSTT